MKKIKEILESGSVALGTAIYTLNPAVVELAGYCGLDFVRIDTEHSWRRDESLENICRAADCAGIASIVRVDGDPHLIRKALEVGAEGVLVPHINTMEEAEQVVRAAKFPPKGIRGYVDLCRSAKYGLAHDWISWSNKETMVGVMVEDRRAVDNIGEIMKVEGLDFVLFGRADYSLSIGLPLQVSHPKVIEGLKNTIEAAKKNSKYVGIVVNYPWVEQAKKFIDMGCQLIEIGHDLSILRTIWREVVEDIRKLKKSS